jgi:valyl-tRNA synthetase
VEELTLADRWIIARCNATVVEATEAYQRFRLNDAAAAVYHFIWSDLADWYIEQVKPRLYGDLPGGDVARAVVAQTFDVALRLLHPVMPFITEALWRRFPGRADSASISVAPWPAPDPRARDPEALKEFGLVQELVSAIRAIRAEYGVQPGQLVRAVVSGASQAAAAALKHERPTITRLAKLSELSLGESRERVGGHAVLSDGTAVFVPLGDAIDVGRECGRLGTEVDRLRKLVESQEKKLGNEQFVSRAPTDVVERERQKLTTWKDQREVLAKKRELLGCS